MKYLINVDNPKDVLLSLHNRLMQVEVKGVSIEHLYVALSTIKQLHDSIEEIPDEEEVKT